MTNREFLFSLTNDELANFLNCHCCAYKDKCNDCDIGYECRDSTIEWLESEAE